MTSSIVIAFTFSHETYFWLAASTLEQLLKVYTENGSPAADRQMVTSRLVIAYASFDAKASEKYAAQLPKLAAITTGEKVRRGNGQRRT